MRIFGPPGQNLNKFKRGLLVSEKILVFTISQFTTCDPLVGPFFTTEPLGDATYQISMI